MWLTRRAQRPSRFSAHRSRSPATQVPSGASVLKRQVGPLSPHLVRSGNPEAPPGLTIASLRNMAAGFRPDTPLLAPWADGEGTEPLVMASAVHVGPNLMAGT